MRNLKPILLVEDDRIDVMMFKRAVEELNITSPLVQANNGEEALQYLRDESNEKPGIILLDLNMPKMNGIEFLKVVKADDILKTIPVVVLTTSQEEEDVIESFKLSIAGYMVKPHNYKKLMKTIASIESYWTLSELPNQEMGVKNANIEANIIS